MMKYAVLVFLLLSSCAGIKKVSEIDFNENFPHDEIQKVAVIMFETIEDDKKDSMFFSKTSISPDAGLILARMTARELTKLGKYVVINRDAVIEDLKSKNVKLEDFLLTQSFFDLGKQLGADAIIIGRVEGFGISYKPKTTGMFLSPVVTKVSFTVQCVDITTEETIWTVKIKGSSLTDNERALASKLISESFKTLKTKLN